LRDERRRQKIMLIERAMMVINVVGYTAFFSVLLGFAFRNNNEIFDHKKLKGRWDYVIQRQGF